MTQREFEHFELNQLQEPLPRRTRAGGRAFVRDDQPQHGQQLLLETERIAKNLTARTQNAPVGINPKLIFKLKLDPKASLTDGMVEQMGLHPLARGVNKVIVVFPDDATLSKLKQQLREYAGVVADGHKYGNLASIIEISELEPEDRTGLRLKSSPLASDEVVPLDIELWHTGNRNECEEKIEEIKQLLATYDLSVTDQWIGESLCIFRAKLNKIALDVLLTIDYVKEIDRRPSPSFEMIEVMRLGYSDIRVEEDLEENLVGVLIIDSGVMQAHPLLAPCLGDAQVFPDRLAEKVVGGAEDGDEYGGGHGTAVAGVASYSDIGEGIKSRTFKATARIFSARVTDQNNQYDEDELLEHQLEKAVSYFLDNYPQVKVINISLGHAGLVFADNPYQFRFAAAIDELAYRYRDREIVFVVSAGNFDVRRMSAEDLKRLYPQYLFKDKEAHLIDPATSALALTVGGLSYGPGRHYSRAVEENDIDQLIAREPGWPSSFTRVGFGVDGAIKPDVVEYAGDTFFTHSGLQRQAGTAGIPVTARDFGPPAGRLFRTAAGTSFAAPKVANLAARLFEAFPDKSSNLIRALIADSARIPDNRPSMLMDKNPSDKEILRLYGYGQPDYERARFSAQNAAVLIRDEVITPNAFVLYEIPPLSQDFIRTKGRGYISVTLAFDPPTRSTRKDSYLGLTMEYAVFRNVTEANVRDVYKAVAAETEEDNEDESVAELTRKKLKELSSLPVDVPLLPGTRLRSKGTLQRGIHTITGSNWGYNGGPLILAVRCLRKWDKVTTSQRFAIVVSIAHESDFVDVYSQVRQHARNYNRARIRI